MSKHCGLSTMIAVRTRFLIFMQVEPSETAVCRHEDERIGRIKEQKKEAAFHALAVAERERARPQQIRCHLRFRVRMMTQRAHPRAQCDPRLGSRRRGLSQPTNGSLKRGLSVSALEVGYAASHHELPSMPNKSQVNYFADLRKPSPSQLRGSGKRIFEREGPTTGP